MVLWNKDAFDNRVVLIVSVPTDAIKTRNVRVSGAIVFVIFGDVLVGWGTEALELISMAVFSKK